MSCVVVLRLDLIFKVLKSLTSPHGVCLCVTRHITSKTISINTLTDDLICFESAEHHPQPQNILYWPFGGSSTNHSWLPAQWSCSKFKMSEEDNQACVMLKWQTWHASFYGLWNQIRFNVLPKDVKLQLRGIQFIWRQYQRGYGSADLIFSENSFTNLTNKQLVFQLN